MGRNIPIEVPIGTMFGRLMVVAKFGLFNHKMLWCCRCMCGQMSVVSIAKLRFGHTTSCGCAQNDWRQNHGATYFKHGHTSRIKSGDHSRTYETWLMMIQRCYNPKKENYYN